MALAIKRAHNLPYFSTLTDITQNLKSYVFFLSIVWVAVSEKNRFWCIWSGSEKSRSVVWLYHTFQPQYQYVCSHSHSITNAVNLSLSAGLFHPIPKQSVISRSCQSCEYCSYITACHYKLAMTSSHCMENVVHATEPRRRHLWLAFDNATGRSCLLSSYPSPTADSTNATTTLTSDFRLDYCNAILSQSAQVRRCAIAVKVTVCT